MSDLIRIIDADITTADYGIVAHQVNCRHLMGSGVALALRNKFPSIYDEYMKAPAGPSMLGKAMVAYETEEFAICNVYSQLDCGYDGKKYTSIEAVESGLGVVFRLAMAEGLPVILPYKYGSDRGGADWDAEIYPIIEKLSNTYQVKVDIFRYNP